MRLHRLILLLLLLAAGCQQLQRSTTLSQPLQPAVQAYSGGWQPLDTGLERRVIEQRNADGALVNSLYLLRIDQTHYRFDIAYSPGRPQTLERWQQQTGARIIINGGFFTEEYQATGLIVDAGVPSGVSYDFGGMLTINDGRAAIRSLAIDGYQPGEPLDAALQSFPMLLRADGSRYSNGGPQPARRTLIAVDQQQRIIIGVSTHTVLTLAQLAAELQRHDLNLTIALNLDGGPSSGLLLAEPYDIIPAFSLLPTVIIVTPR